MSLVVLVIAVFSVSPHHYEFFFNADMLYLPTLYQGLFAEGYPLKSWYLNPSILLIPDIVIYFLLMLITGDVVVSHFSYGIIQHLLILVFMLYLLHAIYKKDKWILASFGALMMFLFLTVSILDNAFLFAAFSLESTIHTGAFVMMLLCMALTLDYFKSEKTGRLIWLFVLASLSVMSDKLFILLYNIPVILISLFLAILYRKRVPLFLSVTAIISLVTGLMMIEYLDGNYFHLLKLPPLPIYSRIITSFQLMMEQIGGEFIKMGVFSVVVVLSIVSFLIQCFLAFRILIKKQLYSVRSFYIFFSVIFIISVFLMPVYTGTYFNIASLRYSMGAFYLSLLNLGFLAGYFIHGSGGVVQVRRAIVKVALTVLLVSLLIIGFGNLSPEGIRRFFYYYPPYVREVDEIARAENLYCGVASFWYAKPITVFSRENLQVYHAYDQFSAQFHATSSMRYFDRNHVFNFAVLSSFNDTTAYRKYLDHPGRIVKEGATEVLILPPFKFPETNKGRPVFIANDNLGGN